MQRYYHDIPAWLDGTDDLSDGEYRAYHVIICLIYLRDGPIAANERIASKCNQHLNAYRANLKKLIEKGKLQIVDGKIVNSRANAEIAKFRRTSGGHPEYNRGTTQVHPTETRQTPNGHPARKLLKNKRVESPPAGEPLLSFSLSNNSDSKAGVESENLFSLEDSLTQGVEKKKEISKASFDFDEFWRQYPHPVGKRAARIAMEHARKRGAVFAEIMAGLLRYAAKTDDRPWCNPATFLNQERWLDEPARDGGLNVRRDETVAERTARLVERAREAEDSARRAGHSF